MTPEVSRRAGQILGRSLLTDLTRDEHPALIAAIEGAESWSDIPDAPRLRLEELEAQIAHELRSQELS